MSTGPDDAYDLDMATASLLSDSGDVALLLQALAHQLSDGFGDRLTIEHEGGRFRKSDKIHALDVDLGTDAFRAELQKGRVVCTVAHMSGGIRIRSEQVGMDLWLRRLLEALKAEAAHSQNARLALENIIIGGST